MDAPSSSAPPASSNQDDEEPQKLDLPEQLQKIVPATELPTTLNRWNTNEEIASLLIAFDHHKEWLLEKPRIRPASGSLLMYNRKKVKFRRDGYCWKKRRDGKTNREDHMKLKVKGVECIYGSYVHSAILPTFHRRCYWLLQNPHVVLVHYLNVPNPPNNPKPSLMPILSGEMLKKEWTKEELVDQLRPMLASDRQGELNPDQDQKVEETLEVIFQLLVNSQEDSSGGVKRLTVDSNHHRACRAEVVAAASSLITRGDMASLTGALASPRNHCGPHTIMKGEVGCLAQQGVQLGGCVSTMAHLQVSANALTHAGPHFHQHHLQQPLAAAVTAGGTANTGDLHQLAVGAATTPTLTPVLRQVQPMAIPTTTVSTSLSQLTLATLSQMQPASLASDSAHLHQLITSSSDSAHLHQLITSSSAASPVHSGPPPLSTVIPASVNLLTNLPGSQQQQKQYAPSITLLSQGALPSSASHAALSSTFPTVTDCGGLFKGGEEDDLSSVLCMTTSSASASHAPPPLPQVHQNSSFVHVCPSGLVVKDGGALSGVVAFTSSSPSPSSTAVSQFDPASHTPVVGVAPSHTPHCAPAPLPAPSKDIPLFAANPVTLCGAAPGCDGSADDPGISDSVVGVGGRSGVDGGDVGSGGGGGLLDVVGLVDSGDNCDTLDGSFSSLPSTDLNLDLFLDLQDLEDCAADLAAATSLSPPRLPPSPHLPLATSSPLMVDGGEGRYSGHCSSPGRTSLSHPLSHSAKLSFLNAGTLDSTPDHSSPLSTSTPQPSAVLSSCKAMDVNSLLSQQTQTATKNHYNNGGSGSGCNMAATAAVVNICDFSPEWAYTEGNTKVLVAGPWCQLTAVYTCVFDGQHVAATLLQPGVLRCFTQDHKPGCVSLQVAQDGHIISDSHVFEFRPKEAPPTPTVSNHAPPSQGQVDWFDTNGPQLKQLLIDRLGELQRRFISADKISSTLCSEQAVGLESSESSLLCHVERLVKAEWREDHMYPKAGLHGLTLLHLASALGHAKLISALIRWRTVNSSPALEYEVDAHSVDNQACTPLMWACAKGQIDAALTLYHWNGGALGVCNKDGQLPLALARQRGHHNLASQVEQLEQAHFKTPAPAPAKIRCQNMDASSVATAAGSGDMIANSQPQPMSPEGVKVEQVEGDGNHGNGQLAQPMQTGRSKPMPSPSSTGHGKLIRRFSEQVISPNASSSIHPLSKRYSVDLPTSDTDDPSVAAPPASYHMRDSMSEPRLPLKQESDLEGSSQGMPSLNFVLEPSSVVNVKRKMAADRSFLSPHDRGQLPMDTDEGLARSDSPFIDVERVSSDEEAEKQDDSKHQMVTLANQIIAAMPERIKLSPAKGDDEDDGCCIRTRSESHSSSAPSQGSPRPSSSSFGDDSGISTPMTDSLAFEEYRYTDFGTPASSLSPDSTCLPSPYSPYSFALDSPPPTTADFTEYFNAPATYMEKDFSQLTLSDQEQRKLYEAAKVIQNAYRHYRDKQQQQQHQKEIEAAVLIQSYYRRYKQYAYYKKMTHAAVLIQNQFRSYSAQKRKKNPGGSTQGSRRELERLKKGRNQSVIIQQRFRSHYQRKSLEGKEGSSGMGVASGDAPDSSPPSEEVPQPSRDTSPPADAECSAPDNS